MNATVEDNTMTMCRNLPGLSWEHARKTLEIYASMDGSDEKLLKAIEKALRAGEEWAIELSLAAIRLTGDE